MNTVVQKTFLNAVPFMQEGKSSPGVVPLSVIPNIDTVLHHSRSPLQAQGIA